MLRDHHKWFSRSLNRDMELLMFGHAGPPVMVSAPPSVALTVGSG